jgi:hypothetical protein
MTLQAGDKIWTNGRLGARHYGIYAGNGYVIHASKDLGHVACEPLATFLDGEPVWIDSRAKAGFEWVVVQRAKAYMGRPYDLVWFNCEHLASIAQDGEASSPQLQRAVLALAGFGLLTLIGVAAAPAGVATASVLALTGYDVNVGRWRDGRGRFTS